MELSRKGVILSPKDINNIRGALRKAQQRSEYYKAFLDSQRIVRPHYNKDGSRSKRDRVFYRCNSCQNEFSLKDIQIDHIDPIGSLKSIYEVQKFIERLYCPYDNLQIICKDCHKVKTKFERMKF